MSSGGYLKRPSNNGEQSEQQKRLWNDTSTRLDKFLPSLMPGLFPEPDVKEGERNGAEGVSNRVETGASASIAEEKGPEVA
jgi:brefeldin A-resistance guanine nucleotide exchange factor 1